MQHNIALEELDGQGPAMAKAIESCVHCGFCLPACPTYKVLGEEMDSPRGRILLMKSVLEGTLTAEETAPYIDRCLGCQGCVTACPSGVRYGDLIMAYRSYAEARRSRSMLQKVQRALVQETIPHPGRFRTSAALGRLARPLGGLLPDELGGMLALLPDRLPAAERLPGLIPAEGMRRARVALLAGCVQQALAPEINRATLRVLARNGVEVVIPRDQGCCGALSMHTGHADRARAFARANLRAFPADVDAIVTNAAGCGSGLHEYGLLFAGLPEEEEAAALGARAVDVSVFLMQLGFVEPGPLPAPLRLAYHDACHLAHAQKVTDPPRRLLRSIPNVTLLEIPEGEICCGSAGTYNLEQPEIAAELGRRKAANLRSTGAEAVAAGNIGCMVQMRTYLKDAPVRVYHTMEVLQMGYEGAAGR
jgi:glycolate oxidase iron-sulfur subunit